MADVDVAGRRVLVVEDEVLIAFLIEETLAGMGCEIVGPAANLDAALQLANEAAIDAAILDVSIRDGKVYPVAARLEELGIPFAFASGYGDWTMPDAMRDRPRLAKPFTIVALEQQIRSLCQRPVV